MSLFDDIFEDDELEPLFIFTFSCRFRIIDTDNGYRIEITKVYKKSYDKKHESYVNKIVSLSPINISEISGLELSRIKTNKLFDGNFEIHLYVDDFMDIFFKGLE